MNVEKNREDEIILGYLKKDITPFERWNSLGLLDDVEDEKKEGLVDAYESMAEYMIHEIPKKYDSEREAYGLAQGMIPVVYILYVKEGFNEIDNEDLVEYWLNEMPNLITDEEELKRLREEDYLDENTVSLFIDKYIQHVK